MVMFRERISGTTMVTSGALCRSAWTSFIVVPTAWSARYCCDTGMSCSSMRTFSSPPMATSASFIPFSMPFTSADIATRLETPR
jgi:hypothetical protein